MELKAILESLIFASDRPITAKQLKSVTGSSADKIRVAIEDIEAEVRGSGIQLVEVGGGYQFRTHPENAPWVKKLLAGRPPRLTQAMLEVLAIIAYRQPVTRPEIEDIRGVDCGGVIRLLLERSLVRILGKKEEAGRPILYGTTKQFLEFFHLNDLKELPTLKEFTELSEEHAAQLEDELGEPIPGEVAGPDDQPELDALPAPAASDLAPEDLTAMITLEDPSSLAPEASLAPADPLEEMPAATTLEDPSSLAPEASLAPADPLEEMPAATTLEDPSSLAQVSGDATSEGDPAAGCGSSQTWARQTIIVDENEDDESLQALDRALEQVDEIMKSQRKAEQERLAVTLKDIPSPAMPTSSGRPPGEVSSPPGSSSAIEGQSEKVPLIEEPSGG